MHTLPFGWHNQKIIVTGGAGFLGGHLVNHLTELGTGELVIPRSRDYDLREKDAVMRLYAEHRDATVVIHLAATVGGIGINREHPGTFFYDNIMMGTLMLEYARQTGIPKFVAVGTICSYPKYAPIPFHEDSLWEGYPEETNAPYGLAKKMLLVQSQAYRTEFNYNSINLLPVNLYGPRDNFNPRSAHVIPDLIRKMTEAKTLAVPYVTLFGDGSPTREFLYVTDAARAIALATAHFNASDPVNIGSGFEISIRDLAALIAQEVGFAGEIRWDTSKPNGQPRRKLDVSRAEKLFRFTAEINFQEGLRETIRWYQTQTVAVEG